MKSSERNRYPHKQHDENDGCTWMFGFDNEETECPTVYLDRGKILYDEHEGEGLVYKPVAKIEIVDPDWTFKELDMMINRLIDEYGSDETSRSIAVEFVKDAFVKLSGNLENIQRLLSYILKSLDTLSKNQSVELDSEEPLQSANTAVSVVRKITGDALSSCHEVLEVLELRG